MVNTSVRALSTSATETWSVTMTGNPIGPKSIGATVAAPIGVRKRPLVTAWDRSLRDAFAPLDVTVTATPMTPETVLRLIHGASR